MTASGSYLEGILDYHRGRAEADRRPIERLREQVTGLPPVRGFRRSLMGGSGVAVIAEIKRRSPSAGELCGELDPAALASSYARGGATCLSVLTDGPYFGGSPDDVASARDATTLPVLRKDFTVAERDVLDTRLMRADALLLIVAALDDAELAGLLSLARDVGLDCLVEVHDREEVERAIGAGADMVGVNQRDLWTFEVDRGRAVGLADALPEGVVKVAESGIRSRDDIQVIADAGYHGALVGEAVVTSGDPERAVAALVGVEERGKARVTS